MEGPTMDWKMEEYPSDEGDGKMSWIWSKGVSFGKKIVVAGVVASSAPLVVPPLVVASTIAVISSVPYCLFLATYACTEKLMSVLLPSPASPSLPSYDKGKVWDIGKDESGFEDYGMEENKLRYDEAMTGGDEAVRGMDEPSLVQVSPILVRIEEEEITVEDEGKEEKIFGVTNIEVDVYERPAILDDEEMVREPKSLMEKIRDEDRTDKALDKSIGDKPSEEETKPIVSGRALKGKGGAGVQDLPAKKGETEIRHVDGKGETGQQKLDKQQGRLESTAAKTSEGKDDEVAPNEVVVYSEEQIWEKMDAMRRIVGYSSKRSTTCVEELKALYIFTGVEPPASIKDPNKYDVAQVSDRLRFLMSIIGIK